MLGLFNGLQYEGASSADTSYANTNISNVSFDGVNDYILINCVKDYINVEEGTISAWVRLEADAATTRVFSVQEDANNMIELLWVGGSNYFRGKYRADGNSSLVNTAASTDYEDGNWYHVVMTWDIGSGDKVQMYLNGETANNVTGLDDTAWTPARVYLGAKSDASASGFLTGLMDEVTIYREAKDSTWVTAAYNSGKPTDLTGEVGIIHSWRFEEGTGTSAVDTVRWCDGVLTNGAAFSADNLLTM